MAAIYRSSKYYPLYRVVWTVAGVAGKPKRMMKGFPRYSEAKTFAHKQVKDLAKGSQVTALTPGRASDALAALGNGWKPTIGPLSAT